MESSIRNDTTSTDTSATERNIATKRRGRKSEGKRPTTLDRRTRKRKIASDMAARLHFLFATLGKLRLKTDLARYLDVTTMTISRWVNDKAAPSVDQITRIAAFVVERFDLGEGAAPGDVLVWLQEDGRDKVAAALRTATPRTNEIRALRDHLGLTAEDAAERLGISRQSLYAWEYEPKATSERLERCRAAWRSE